MKPKSIISYYSLLTGLIAGVRVGNLSRSYADSYNQVNGLRMGTVAGANASAQNQNAAMPTMGLIGNGDGVTTAVDNTGAVVALPIRVANAGRRRRWCPDMYRGCGNACDKRGWSRW